VRFGLLEELIPREKVCQAAALIPDRINDRGDRVESWRERVFSPVTAIYFVVALCLFSRWEMGYERVARWVFKTPGGSVSSGAVARMRRRLGEAPLRGLFVLLKGTLARGYDTGCHFRGLLLTSHDGTSVDMPDTPENRRRFTACSEGGYLRARIVALIECGTRAVIDAAIGALGESERVLFGRLCASLKAGMLNLADRGFFSWQLWQRAAGTGAELLWRIKSDISLPVIAELDDGSYLTVIGLRGDRDRYVKAVRAGKIARMGPSLCVARVLVFTIEVVDEHGEIRIETYRLLTTLVDHVRFPASALAKLYAKRWLSETAYFDLKITLRGADVLLRSRTPDMVRQEIWAFLVAYQAIRIMAAKAARRRRVAPGRVSFSRTLDEIQLSIVNPPDPAIPEVALWRAAADAIARHLLPIRPFRSYPRSRKLPKSPHPTPRKAPPRTLSYKIHMTVRQRSPAKTYALAS
jgi:hypothetical protein